MDSIAATTASGKALGAAMAPEVFFFCQQIYNRTCLPVLHQNLHTTDQTSTQSFSESSI